MSQTSAAPSSPPPEAFDPEGYRMSVGDHLEELRRRVIYGLFGFVIAFIICSIFGEAIVSAFCQPLVMVLQHQRINPQLYVTEVSQSFIVYLKISLIVAGALAGPWMLWQLWMFVAAGLYPRERKTITRYIPLSVGLMIAGMVFVYWVVLPLTLEFFIGFGSGIEINLPPLPSTQPMVQTLPTVTPLPHDPVHPRPYEFWFDDSQQRLKFATADGLVRVIPFGPEKLIAPMISLTQYIDMVVALLLTFGLCFQLPLVELTLVRIGILELDTLKRSRRIVYFALSVLAAFIMADVVTGMIALLIPLILLYEFGIFLCRWRGRQIA